MRLAVHLTSVALISSVAIAGNHVVSHAETPPVVSVRAKPVTVETVQLSGTRTPVVLPLALTGQAPFSWSGKAVVRGSDTYLEMPLTPLAGAPALKAGKNDLAISTNALFRGAGRHQVHLTVTDATGRSASTTVTVSAIGKAQTMRVKGVYSAKATSKRKVVWGTAGIENPEAGKYRVFYKAKGKKKFTALGRVSVGPDRVWKLRSARVGAGTYYVATDSQYLRKAKSKKVRISTSDIRNRVPARLR